MKIRTLLRRGVAHKDFCEDFLMTQNLNNRFFIGAIFDGCSSGVESHFASALLAKIIRNVCRILSLNDVSEFTRDTLSREILFQTVGAMKIVKHDLHLSTQEMLATIILLIKNNITDNGIIVCLGDGYISVNGDEIEIDQDNRPDYLTYHIENIKNRGEFNKWYNTQDGVFLFDKVENITISSDGILTFRSDLIGGTADKISGAQINPVDYLVNDTYLQNNKLMLSRKCNILKNKYGLENYDDISIIRLIK